MAKRSKKPADPVFLTLQAMSAAALLYILWLLALLIVAAVGQLSDQEIRRAIINRTQLRTIRGPVMFDDHGIYARDPKGEIVIIAEFPGADCVVVERHRNYDEVPPLDWPPVPPVKNPADIGIHPPDDLVPKKLKSVH